jgi:hypothetical protein
MRANALIERLGDDVESPLGMRRGRPGGVGAVQHLQPAGTPARIPTADVGGRHQFGGDLGLAAAGGNRAGLQADALERLIVAQTTALRR